MFWTRTTSTTATTVDETTASRVLQSATNRSMGFFASLDLRNGSDGHSTIDNQSAGEQASEETAILATDNDPMNLEDSIGLPPSYILSEQRRNELLCAARATRTTWVDGNGEGSNTSQWTTTHTPGTVPPHCATAVEQIQLEMQTLVMRLDELKRKIIPNDVLSADVITNDNNALPTITIVEELRLHQTELESWRRVHMVNGRLSQMQRKRLTASDKESLFLLAFQDLLKLLKHPLAAEIVYQIQLFVQKFEHWNLENMLRHRALPDRPGGYVQAFIDKVVVQLQRTGISLFEAADVEILSLEDDEDQLLCEVLEAFLLEKLYAKALTPSAKAEQEDDALRDRLESLSFVEFRHLDLPSPASDDIEHQWTRLTEELAMISRFPSPRRKMDCVMRVCQGLTSLLSSLHADNKFPSADEFLPGLIYLLLKSNPRQLKRNVHFILEYRRPSRLVSEPGYFFTHLVSSVAFLEEVNGELLTITPEEFEAGLKKSKKQVVVDVAQPVETNVSVVENHEHEGDVSVGLSKSAKALPQLPTVLEVRARRMAALVSSS